MALASAALGSGCSIRTEGGVLSLLTRAPDSLPSPSPTPTDRPYFVSPEAESPFKNSFEIKIACTEGATVAVTGDIAPIASQTCPTEGELTFLATLTAPDGSKTVTVTETYTEGDPRAADLLVLRDTTNPLITIATPASSALLNSATVLVTGTCESGLTVRISGDVSAVTGPCNAGTFSINAALTGPDGAKNITAEQTDAAGNLGEASISITLDATPPAVTGVTSSLADGTYSTSQAIDIQVSFSEAVLVDTTGGTPLLALNTTPERSAVYQTGSGTTTLTFRYTASIGDSSPDLDYGASTSLGLNGGSLRDAAGNNATLTLPAPGSANSLGGSKEIVIDAVPPTVVGVTSSLANGAYGINQTIDIVVSFSKIVTVNTGGGTPSLTLNTTPARTSMYFSGTGTSNLTFRYTVTSGDTSAQLDYASTSALALNGGTIRDAASNNAVLTLATPGAAGSLGSTRNIMIDTTPPNVNLSSVPVAAAGGTVYGINITASESGSGLTEIKFESTEDGTNYSTLHSYPYSGNSNAAESYNWTPALKNLPEGKIRIRATDQAGNVGMAVQSVPVASVLAEYTVAPDWNDWVNTASKGGSPTACAGTETESTGGPPCFHAGEHKRVLAAGKTSCAGLTATDALGVFDWQCRMDGIYAYFYSRLKSGSGLSNLIDGNAPEWKGNAVTIIDSGTPILTTKSDVWWQNEVRPLPTATPSASLALPGNGHATNSIYVVSSNQVDTGFVLTQDKLGLVVMPGARLSQVLAASNNCASNGRACLISASNRKFLWIEGRLSGTNSSTATDLPDHLVRFDSVKFSVLNSVDASTANMSAIGVFSSNNNTFRKIRAMNSANGFYVKDSESNRFHEVVTSNHSSEGMRFEYGSKNVLQNIVSTHNTGAGIELWRSHYNRLSQLTFAGNGGQGIMIHGSEYPIVQNALITGVAGMGGAVDGIYVLYATENLTDYPSHYLTFSQLALGHASWLIYSQGAFGNENTNLKILGNFLQGPSASGCGSNYGTAIGLSGCASTSPSSFNQVGSLNFSSVYLGGITSDSTNASHSSGTGVAGSITDWLRFDSWWRSWGRKEGFYSWDNFFESSSYRGRCFGSTSPGSGDCRIFDWALPSSGSGNPVRNTSDSGTTGTPNASFTPNNACPSLLNGNVTLEAYGNITYLKNAVEILGDGVGNDNGLCEAGERCLYTPNFGAYQGHGTLGSCTFSANGGLSNIQMLGYGTNGY